jgi:hypothetical protein
MLVPAAHVVMALIAHISGPLMGISPALSSSEPPPPMQITIADDVAKVRGSETVTYEVIVVNPSGFRLPVLVQVTLAPAVFSEIRAEDGTIVANAIAWKGLLNRGRTRVLMVVGVLHSTVDAPDLAATACVHLSADTPALACATDVDTIIPPPDRRWITWSAAIALGLVAVAGSVWLQRKVTPAPLTPASAHAEFGPPDVPSQPGGAPSV